MKKIGIILIVSVCLPAWGGDFLHGWDSVSQLERSAYAGKPAAQAALGRYYFATQQYELALSWLEKAAQKNDGEGFFALGYCYETGRCGQGADLKKAVSYYQKSAHKKNANGLYRLGYLQYEGKGLAKNPRKAKKSMEQAANKGSQEAQSFLAQAYYSGNREGIEQNYEQARKQWEKLAAGEDLQARVQLANLYANGQGVAQNLHKAFVLNMSAAQDGLAEAQYQVAVAYLEGQGVEQDEELGVIWLEKAAAQGWPAAMEKLKKAK